MTTIRNFDFDINKLASADAAVREEFNNAAADGGHFDRQRTHNGLIAIASVPGVSDEDGEGLVLWDADVRLEHGVVVVTGYEGACGFGARIEAHFTGAGSLVGIKQINNREDRDLGPYTGLVLSEVYLEPRSMLIRMRMVGMFCQLMKITKGKKKVRS